MKYTGWCWEKIYLEAWVYASTCENKTFMRHVVKGRVPRLPILRGVYVKVTGTALAICVGIKIFMAKGAYSDDSPSACRRILQSTTIIGIVIEYCFSFMCHMNS